MTLKLKYEVKTANIKFNSEVVTLGNTHINENNPDNAF